MINPVESRLLSEINTMYQNSELVYMSVIRDKIGWNAKMIGDLVSSLQDKGYISTRQPRKEEWSKPGPMPELIEMTPSGLLFFPNLDNADKRLHKLKKYQDECREKGRLFTLVTKSSSPDAYWLESLDSEHWDMENAVAINVMDTSSKDEFLKRLHAIFMHGFHKIVLIITDEDTLKLIDNLPSHIKSCITVDFQIRDTVSN